MRYYSSASELSLQGENENGPGTPRKRYKSALIRRFDFSSAKQRMSVICKNSLDGKLKSFVKGSPEMLQTLCRPETIPADFSEILAHYTKEGFRVIALAYKDL